MERKHDALTPDMNGIVAQIKTVLDTARSNVARQVNSELLNTY